MVVSFEPGRVMLSIGKAKALFNEESMAFQTRRFYNADGSSRFLPEGFDGVGCSISCYLVDRFFNFLGPWLHPRRATVRFLRIAIAGVEA